MEFPRRTWLEIDLDAIVSNVEKLSKLSHCKTIIPVVKADAYSHGCVEVSLALESLNTVGYFGVGCLQEAISLRKCGIKKPILILGHTAEKYAHLLAEYSLTQTVSSLEYARALSSNITRNLDVHIKIDTGMGRLGIVASEDNLSEAVDEISKVCAVTNINAVGIYTHFADSESEDVAFCDTQQNLLNLIIKKLSENEIEFTYKHSCNSGGVLYHPEHSLNMVRLGFAMYGYSPKTLDLSFNLTPAKSVKSTISQIKTLKKGTTISYGRTLCLERDTIIAVINAGYADGIPRRISNVGNVLIKGRRAKILGAVCMDMMMVDITDFDDVGLDDIVTLLGQDRDEFIGICEWASLAEQSQYELLVLKSNRTPRVYIKNGEIYKIDEI